MQAQREKVKLAKKKPTIIRSDILAVSKNQNKDIQLMLQQKISLKDTKKKISKEKHADTASKLSFRPSQADTASKTSFRPSLPDTGSKSSLRPNQPDTASKSSLQKSQADSALHSSLRLIQAGAASKLLASGKVKSEGTIHYDTLKKKTLPKSWLNKKTEMKNKTNITANKYSLKNFTKHKVASQNKNKVEKVSTKTLNEQKPEWLTATLQTTKQNEEPYSSLILGNNPYTYYHLIDYMSYKPQCKPSCAPYTYFYQEKKSSRTLLEGRFSRYLGSTDVKLQKESTGTVTLSSFPNEQLQSSSSFHMTSPYDLLHPTSHISTPFYDATKKERCEKVSIHATTPVLDKVQLIGTFPITVGKNTKLHHYVSLHALRGPIQIGDSNTLEEFVSLCNNCSEPLIIGNNNIIRSHANIVDGTHIGNFNEIGDAALLENQTVIEDHCVVTQHSHLTHESIQSNSIVFGRDKLIKRVTFNDLNCIQLEKSPLRSTLVSN